MIKNLLKNKRGDIPITILVIGVLVICILAIFSFYSSSKSVKNDFSSISAIEEVLLAKEKISLYESFGFKPDEIKEIFGIKDDIQGRYIIAEEGSVLVRYNLP